MSKWKFLKEEKPTDDDTYLVSWKDCEGHYSDPIRACWVEAENSFFAIENEWKVPLKVDAYYQYSIPSEKKRN